LKWVSTTTDVDAAPGAFERVVAFRNGLEHDRCVFVRGNSHNFLRRILVRPFIWKLHEETQVWMQKCRLLKDAVRRALAG